jgi:molybdopterin-guanine dinucleotide biosynthesis protein A
MQTRRQQTPEGDLCHDRLVEASTTAAAIVAGGRARRFAGQDKSRLVVEGRTIIVRQVEILQRVACPVFVVGGAPERFADLDLPVHPDAIAGAGALGGIYTALTIDGPDAVIVVACDMPFLDPGLLRRLVQLSDGHDGAWVRSARGVEPLLACYRRRAASLIRQEIDAARLKATNLAHVLRMAEMSMEEVAVHGSPARLLANLNSSDDLARVQYGGS